MTYDCAVIGGGPAGLTAAIYLARYRRNILVCDAGNSRALAIPKSRNYPGFADGVSGPELLKRLRDQLRFYAVEHRMATVEALEQTEHGFMLTSTAFGKVAAQCILLATGLSDKVPEIAARDKAALRSVVRYCPVCDGYEASDRKIAIFGPLEDVATKALFLRTYSKSVTILPSEPRSGMDAGLPERSGIQVAAAPPRRMSVGSDGVEVWFDGGHSEHFDVLYPALGCDVHSELAKALGARCNEVGCLQVNDKQQTSVTGLYAAGDIVSDLHQLTVAAGHAAIAATAIHNALPPNLRS